ncbi:BsuPI-related putative proteinase inhibitor [Parachitinimonas caeni]|uniref:Intracellular proteinase inhibitor BsuPI domain-containing protein n=1 Tax=Parachitinimonas caeni TaxID=3031301 RepID=A0ABT7DWJ2_9NEIS|nr:BsuPI-related putative proteinase inhibitor [Parachitinimonas caeni]MDK2124431.1 BsuPI-related putative proteinase inhibitor [Parachitinimonas caeni]
MKIRSLNIALMGMAVAATASASTYIATVKGDTATFTSNRGQEVQVNVTDVTSTAWRKYSDFAGTGERWIWADPNGESIFTRVERTNQSAKIVDFNDAVGTRYTSTGLGACQSVAVLADKGMNISTAAGTFSNVARVTFSGQCADAGTGEAYFAPKVGLIKWTSQTIAGPNVFELSKATVGGKNFPEGGLKVAATFPSSRLVLGRDKAEVEVALDITNGSNSDMTFTFPSGQDFDITLTNATGQVINSWGADKRFIMAIHNTTLKAGETRRYAGTLAVRNLNGASVDIGTYKLGIELKGSNAPAGSVFVPETVKAEAPLYIDRMMTISTPR